MGPHLDKIKTTNLNYRSHDALVDVNEKDNIAVNLVKSIALSCELKRKPC